MIYKNIANPGLIVNGNPHLVFPWYFTYIAQHSFPTSMERVGYDAAYGVHYHNYVKYSAIYSGVVQK